MRQTKDITGSSRMVGRFTLATDPEFRRIAVRLEGSGSQDVHSIGISVKEIGI